MTDKMREDFEAWHKARATLLAAKIEQTRLDFIADGFQDSPANHQAAMLAVIAKEDETGWDSWQAATLTANQWRPIETAPKGGAEYWATDGTHFFTESQPPNCFPGQWTWFEKEQCWGGSMSTYKATGWLPLPPTGTGGNV